MDQEITYSSSLIKFLHLDNSILEMSDQKKVWQLIEQNYVVSDAELKILKSYGEEVKKLQSSVIKQELQNFVDGLINNKAKKRRTYNVTQSYDDQEINITLSSNDKIYFNSLYSEKDIKSTVKKYPEIETHNVSSFLSPMPIDKLKHIPSTIPLEKGIYYDLQTILDPFLRNSKNIRIEDPYLPNNTASYNVLKIIENLRHKNITLVFLTRSKYAEHPVNDKRNKKESVYNKFIEKLKSLNSDGYRIKFDTHFKKKTHRERYLFTEDFQIYFPGGFDLLETDGRLRNDFNSEVDERKEIRIEKRNFAIEF